MATDDKRAACEVLESLARDLNCLNEEEKNTRKSALESIKRKTINKGLQSAVLQEVFACLQKSLLKCLSDPMERCRELAIQIFGDFVRCVPKPEDSLPYLIPALAQRLGENKILEPTEELRLSMVELLALTLEVCGGNFAPYLDDIIKILKNTITDPFPEVKRESCKLTINCARCVTGQFHMQAECLIKPLMQTISHHHSRVRVAAIEAVGAVILYGPVKNMDDVLSHLAQRLFDDSPQVRKTVTLVVGDWLLNLRDRYSYFHKLIPLLLSSLSDDLPEIKTLAWKLWRQVGTQWEIENKDDLKDKIDFHLPSPLVYQSVEEQPGRGCKELVVRNLAKLMSAVSRDASDWLVQTRVKTIRLLRIILLHAEDHCTQHLQPLLAILYLACADSDQDVIGNGLESARLLGVFVSPEVFLKLLLPHVENSSLCSSSPWAPLMVLAAVLKGSSRKALCPHLLQIGETLGNPDVCQESQQIMYLEQMLACVEAVLEVCDEDCYIISFPLLKILVIVQSLSTEHQLCNKAKECLMHLCRVLSLNNVFELYQQHMVRLLHWLSESHHSWSTYSTQKTQLEVIALQSGPVLGEFVPEFLSLLQKFLKSSQDPEMRLHIFTMLSKLLLKSRNTLNSTGKFCEHLNVFLQELILPNLVWHAGRAAAAVRTSALSCVLAMLQGDISKVQVLNAASALSAHLIAALGEDSQFSRLLACRSINSLLNLTGQSLNTETLNSIYPELLKQLDDSNEEVRIEALNALRIWFSSLGKDNDINAYRPHLQFLIQHLLLYLDDSDQQIQLITLDVLKASGVVDPVLLKHEVEAVKDKQRSSKYCDELLNYIRSQ
ncbi:dynein axonemal assembly factor 5-like [Trichomycterus rosablanca]|uniref:dynein axonemal assembly factor 5-like n=1 Tax=Trichomycterus rosablanca TaxID=2290929 RepID=UPI002F35D72D